MRGRYQQGIGIPTTLGIQPTIYKAPEGRVTSFTLPRYTAGVHKNFGSAGGYVNTMPSRWQAKPWPTLDKANRMVGKMAGTANSTPSTPFSAPISSSAPPPWSAPTGSGSSVPNAPASSRNAPNMGLAGPPVPGTGVDIPPAPKTAPSLGLGAPPVPGTQADFLKEMISQTPDLSQSPTGAEFRDTEMDTEMDNPLPQGDYTPGRALDTGYMYQQQGRRSGNKRKPL